MSGTKPNSAARHNLPTTTAPKALACCFDPRSAPSRQTATVVQRELYLGFRWCLLDLTLPINSL